MRGTGYEAVVLHREYPVTKQTSLQGTKRRGNLMLKSNNPEITTLSSIARDDNFFKVNVVRSVRLIEGKNADIN